MSQVTETAREEALYAEVQRQVEKLAAEIDVDGQITNRGRLIKEGYTQTVAMLVSAE